MRDGDIRLARFKGHIEDRDKKVREIAFLEKCSVCSRASVRKDAVGQITWSCMHG